MSAGVECSCFQSLAGLTAALDVRSASHPPETHLSLKISKEESATLEVYALCDGAAATLNAVLLWCLTNPGLPLPWIELFYHNVAAQVILCC